MVICSFNTEVWIINQFVIYVLSLCLPQLYCKTVDPGYILWGRYCAHHMTTSMVNHLLYYKIHVRLYIIKYVYVYIRLVSFMPTTDGEQRSRAVLKSCLKIYEK